MSTKPLKFPLELYDHPSIRKLNVFQAGLFRLLIEYYWKTGIDLPKSDNALQRLSNASYKAFKHHAYEVKEALNITMPAFIEARKLRMNIYVMDQRKACKMRAKVKSKGYSKDKTFSDSQDTHLEIIPVNLPRENWNAGRFDHVERDKALASDKDKTVKFKDKPKT